MGDGEDQIIQTCRVSHITGQGNVSPTHTYHWLNYGNGLRRGNTLHKVKLMMTGHDWFPISRVGVSMYSCFQTYRRSQVHYWCQQARDWELLHQPVVRINSIMLRSNRASVPSVVRSLDIKKKNINLEYKCIQKWQKISLTSRVASSPYKTKW
jgi:hypothetical protein